ncbi:MAG TPA: FAD-dependent monooxygenase [Pseudolabrys sp.]|nr:FAD-dependent monooxygenase [Pseudolabrys sp.]
MTDVETIVVGGGPAGAATACGLAAHGREVMLIEREASPHHKVCGEFLSVETQAQLSALGIDAAALGAVPIGRVAIYAGARQAAADLPFRALSLSRLRLDDALLSRAQSLGAQVQHRTVRRVGTDDKIVSCDNGQVFRCRHLVVATGKKRLRGLEDRRDSSRVGLKMHMRLTEEARRALNGTVELYFCDSGYVGLEPIENDIANLCLLMPRQIVARLSHWSAIKDHLITTLPALAARLAGAQPVWEKPMAVVCPAGAHLQRRQDAAVYRVGDRLAHIPPFTGDGLAIALASGTLAATYIRRGLPPERYLAAAQKLAAAQLRFAGVLSSLAQARAGRAALIALARVPRVLQSAVRRTRVPLPSRADLSRRDLPIRGRTVS